MIGTPFRSAKSRSSAAICSRQSPLAELGVAGPDPPDGGGPCGARLSQGHLQVRTSNAGVVGFYEKLGYRVEELVSMGKRLY
jgi:hypothetical protein